tara:strand:- start:45 stop:956 length:912 start_codon:yes stop_codon:yes gene_type:complete
MALTKVRGNGIGGTGSLTLDVANDVIVDADGGDIIFKDDGTSIGRFINSSGDFVLQSDSQDKDIIFKGDDNGSTIEAMRVDMSAGGNLGINTTSPVTKLHVNADANDLLTLERSGKSSGSGFAGFNIETNSQLTIAYDDGASFIIGTASDPSTQAGFSQTFKLASNGNCNIPGVYSNTTSNSANVACHYSSGDLQRSTSSRRYKNTIKDLDVGLAELNKLRTVSFKGNNDGDIIFNGLIAEEVHDVGLTQFVEYDDENRPDGLRYPHMVSLCIKAIQELSTKVDDLEKKNDALEARIKKLEGS